MNVIIFILACWLVLSYMWHDFIYDKLIEDKELDQAKIQKARKFFPPTMLILILLALAILIRIIN